MVKKLKLKKLMSKNFISSQNTRQMRKEIKIPLDKNLKGTLNHWCDFKNKLFKTHRNRIVNSIYYDDSENNLARDNLSGISERKKFRIRWYDNDVKNFNYEIKKKKDNLGTKIILDSGNRNYNYEKLFSLHNPHFFKKENNYFLKEINNYNLKPKIQVSYLRSYYLYNGTVRVTLDQNLKYKDLNKFNLKDLEVKDSFNILEIKFDPKKTSDVSSLLKKTQFLPKRFSKYLRGLHLLNIAQYI
jgi:hypothetical protein